ncbi:competence/damage-inducible protein A [Periweissella cryptocerci]|uniref:Putative competence-damage inducible protein n=1 Tax=Periweissella cryptocerci TaxID=2506420 RepID=A0A4P6YV95_9LACO|nr:competence/damage-inducible protein A [Periweissella cryptocerci]QBO36749.1 competence/damage-inducible protein A [Periweissella cryptocerci]
MQAEIIAVGTEILLGQITDTNSPLVARELVALDIDTHFQTVVGDNEERLLSALEIASQRADLIITIGGLGPTPDDLSKQTVAKFVDQNLAVNQAAMDKIEAWHAETGRPMAENNRLQALYLAAGIALPNEPGFAVGSFYKNPNGPDVLLLPGPPWELEPMLLKYAVPLLQQQYHHEGTLLSRVLRFYGIGESRLVTKLATLIDQQTNPTMAPYAKAHEVTLRLTAHAVDEANATKLLDEMEAQVLAIVGEYFYAYGDDSSLVETVGKLLIDGGVTISAAESLTAGMFQSTLADVMGISAVFPGGFVTYAPTAKEQLVGVSPATVDQYGVVSEQTAKAMAAGTREKLDTDIAISFTGVASGELEGQPAGTVWIGLATRNRASEAYLYHFGSDRQRNRERAVMAGLDIVRRKLLQLPMVKNI